MVERERECVCVCGEVDGFEEGLQRHYLLRLCVGEYGWLPQAIEECKTFGSCLFLGRLSFIHFHNNSTWQSIKGPSNVKAKLSWLGKGERGKGYCLPN